MPKYNSDYLRHPLMEEMANEEIFVSDDCIGLIKFHGGYQQDDRDQRVRGALKKYQFMLRLKMPAGECPASLYTTLDDISESYGNQTLRLTTRSSFQIHAIHKSNLKRVVQAIIHAGGGLYGASGDCSRNVIAPAAPFVQAPYVQARHVAKVVAELFALQSRAFADLWLDGERAATIECWKKDLDMDEVRKLMTTDNGRGQVVPDAVEPLYGKMYLPRKFKVGVTVPGDNSIDIYTHDIGIIVFCDPEGQLEGANLVVGGGMGRTHNKEETFARAADPLGYVPAAVLYDALKAILAAQRDHGNRAVRTNARMKYLVHRMGIDGFRELVRSYMDDGGSALAPMRAMPPWSFQDYLGWHEQGDGRSFLGLYVQNGRIQGNLKQALRSLADRFAFPMVCTPQQNVLITNVPSTEQKEVVSLLESHGVATEPSVLDPLMRDAMACPALPLCPPAITEAERVMPRYVQRVRNLLSKVGISTHESFVMRMTGCPNGCTRPYMAELGFVGSGPNCTYQVWLGGSPTQTRLAWPYLDRVTDAEVERVLEPVFVFWKSQRSSRRVVW
ncbi:hypothetical protein F1559_003184 [Cyanidiococcus yangmingshanensis]|uniref:Uncharacterized protein n=1 Tax=Cyanidiococcus yangmingshanensis TaxID=2690220 RepID=A0A7J7ID30_9RHOD|nr:hypothetical protein F1559_003184 [Cyanidiococcus yangmingshanensis]